MIQLRWGRTHENSILAQFCKRSINRSKWNFNFKCWYFTCCICTPLLQYNTLPKHFLHTFYTIQNNKSMSDTKSRHDRVATFWASATLITSILMIVFALGFSAWSWSTAYQLYGRGHKVLSVFVIITYVVYVTSLLASIIGGILGILWFVLWLSNTSYALQPKLLSTTQGCIILDIFAWCLVTAVGTALFVISLLKKAPHPFYGFVGAIVGLVFTCCSWVVVRQARAHSEAPEHALLEE